jgi:hypothetical protein
MKASGQAWLCRIFLLVCPAGESYRAIMIRFRSILAISGLIYCAAIAGCGGTPYGGGSSGNGNSSVVLAMTDSPPSNVSLLSAQVTLTGANLVPGNVPLLSSSATVDLIRLQTDIAYIATATNIPAGNYTAVTLTFANPALTFENDMATMIANCMVGRICQSLPTTSNLSVTVPITAFAAPASGVAGLLIDVNLDKLLTTTMGEDFSAGTTAIPFTPGGIGAPAVGAEDVVGQVGNLNTSNNTFTLTNATATYSLRVDTTSAFFFPNSVCTTPGFACLQKDQIVSVDIGLQSNGSILARNIVFEDADSSDTEVEGIVTNTTNVGSRQFDIVVQTLSAPVTGLSVGQNITVQFPMTLPSQFFDMDSFHVDNLGVSTSNFLFAAPSDLVVGQQVSVRRNPTLSAGIIMADRVRLRSSRITATVQVGLPNIILNNLPSIFFGHGGILTITAQTLSIPTTIYYEVGAIINSSNVLISDVVSVRGPLFNVGGNGRTVVTTKVVVKP